MHRQLTVIAIGLAVMAVAVVAWLYYGAHVSAERIAAMLALLAAGIGLKHTLRSRFAPRYGLSPRTRVSLEFALDMLLFATVVFILLPG